VSPLAGRVVEVKAAAGDRVVEGQPLLSLEAGDTGLVAEVYLPPDSEIRQVHPGALVRLSPNTTRHEEDGFLIGRVVSVAEFPASRRGMQARLGNESLVEWLARGGAPFAVQVELPRGPDGAYRWSVRSGAAREIGSGTLCTASVVLREEPPITLVLPWLKRLLGG
jgi:HlyD family secretion protein